MTLAVLPDTQYYAACRSDQLRAQARWVSEQRQRRNIVLALSLGDLTEHNSAGEWQFVRDALEPLTGALPFILASGNHDHGDDGSSNRRWTRLQETFPQPPGRARPLLAEQWRGGDVENAYYRFPRAAYTLGVLVLEWSPRDAVVGWANSIAEKYADDRMILVTHAYVYNDETRYDWSTKGDAQRWNPKSYGTALADSRLPPGEANWHPEGANDGELLWRKLVSRHKAFFLTLSGHVLGDGQGLVSSRGDAGNLVHQVLVNYQMLDRGGLGYLRLVGLSPDGAQLTMSTYSPVLDLTAVATDQSLSLPIDPPLGQPPR